MQDERDRFVWTYVGSPEQVAERRLEAMGRFIADLPAGLQAGRYVAQRLPSLPFADDAFDLATSSHFLFLYSDQLSLGFHMAGIEELLRVAAEVRIYPLIALDGSFSPHVAPIRENLRAQGFEAELISIDFELERGSNQLMRVRRR